MFKINEVLGAREIFASLYEYGQNEWNISWTQNIKEVIDDFIDQGVDYHTLLLEMLTIKNEYKVGWTKDLHFALLKTGMRPIYWNKSFYFVYAMYLDIDK